MPLHKQFLSLSKQANKITSPVLLCSIWAILLFFYKWTTAEVTSAIVLGGFMTFGQQVLWSWYRWLLLSWIITASVAESGTFADDSAFFSDFLTHTPSVSE